MPSSFSVDQQQAVEKAIARILTRDFKVEFPQGIAIQDIPFNSTFLHLTSLHFLQLLLTLEEELHTNISDELFMKATFVRIGDLVDFITQVCVIEQSEEEI